MPRRRQIAESVNGARPRAVAGPVVLHDTGPSPAHDGRPQPVIVVFKHSDAFADLWPGLAGAAGAELRIFDNVQEMAVVREACGLLVAAGGAEEAALRLVAELHGAALTPHLGVVGTACDYRLVASFLQSGATEYFALPPDLGLLYAWTTDCVQRAHQAADAEKLHQFTRTHYDFSRIIGSSPQIRRALQLASKVIPSDDATVLLTGETGTGKDLFAQAIHYNGPRRKKPLVEINCSAVPGTLLESELFGHEKGAFTDARSAKPGLFEVASGGTVFLDEIGDLPLELQPKLLRVLEAGKIRRLGGIGEIEVNCRIVAATHRDLAADVRDGRFRQDLYFRLNVVRIHLPPLRERGEDLLQLADRFLEQFSRKHGLNRTQLDENSREVLMSHPWPGNIRELKNAIERAVLLNEGVVVRNDLLDMETALPHERVNFSFPCSLEHLSQQAAQLMVQRCGGNKLQAARALGISRKYLYALLGPHA